MSTSSDQQEAIADVDQRVNNPIYNFDISRFTSINGQKYKLISALDERVGYSGRFLRHPIDCERKTKINTVQFDWSLSSFAIRVQKVQEVAIRLKGDGNYFNIFVNGEFQSILKATLKATCCIIAKNLSPEEEYTILISKRTEPQMRGAVSTFKVCTFYGFIVNEKAIVLPYEPQYLHKIEFIGDSDTCAFGNEGKVSSSKNFFNMKGRMENVYNGFAGITARMFKAEAHILAWSGKGVHSNSVDWGPTMRDLWKNTLGTRDSPWKMESWIPDAVVVNIGGTDLYPPASAEADVIDAYADLLTDIRRHRPNAHIFCVVCDEGCISSDESQVNRRLVSLQLQEITKLAISKVNRMDPKVHYTFIKIPGSLLDSDYANMMHYAVSGHLKFAEVLARQISDTCQWEIEEKPSTIPYPPSKKEILVPKDDSHHCTIL